MNPVNKPIRYLSLFRHGVDEKRRVQIPAKWRPAEPETEFTMFLWPNGEMKDACLLVLPPAKMVALEERLKAMSLSDPKATALRRALGEKAASVTLDKGGRICIPDHMAKTVEIGNEAVLVGLVDSFEIWSPERHSQASAADQALQEEAFKLI
jgi:MraZ protein